MIFFYFDVTFIFKTTFINLFVFILKGCRGLIAAELKRLIEHRENQLALMNLMENYWKQDVLNKFAANVQSAYDTYNV